jgi:DNA-binding NtrC family response regulator
MSDSAPIESNEPIEPIDPIDPKEHVAPQTPPTLLVVEDDQAMRQMCIQLFERRGLRAEGAGSAAEAILRIRQPDKASIELVLSDVRLGREKSENGIQLLREIKAIKPDMPVLLMTGYATVQDAVEAMKLGAADYVTKPFERAELIGKVEAQLKVRALESEVKVLRDALEERYGVKGLIGNSAGMRTVCERIEAAGRAATTVLITGESGTGKELVARAIHLKSVRRDKPFVPVNCAALPENLIESELFGHEPGAFTGASKEGLGLFRAAHSGMIFLDEVADMPKDVQAKLLRVLQDHRVRPVGSTREINVDVRVIAATNWNVEKAREEGILRSDLYFRLSVIRIDIPPLRERMDDLPLLIRHFLSKHGNPERRMRKVSPEALNAMLAYRWPGNVRELESVIESAYALGREESLTLNDLPRQIANFTSTRPVLPVTAENPAPEMERSNATVEAATADPAPNSSPSTGKGAEGTESVGSGVFSLDAIEKDALVRALQVANGNKSRAAQLLGVSRKRLYRMLYDYGMATPESAEIDG